MKRRSYLYGMLGFLSLLGFLGILTQERSYLAFFAFVVDFQYFFVNSDEMFDAYMRKSATWAFYGGMLTTAAAAMVAYFLTGSAGGETLSMGFAAGWAAAVIIHAVLVAYYSFRERWDTAHD